MNDSTAFEDEALEALVAEATDEFLDLVHGGGEPDVEDYARRYPQIAGVLRELLPAVRLMHLSSTNSGTGNQPSLETDAFKAQELLGSLGDFRLVREIARGGMGIVYEAQQISLNRRVALKVLPFAAALDPKQLERFKHEAQAAAQLHHTHIVPVYAVGCERGVYYYAMQFIEGQSLSELIHQLKQHHGRDAAKSAPPPAPPAAETVVDNRQSASTLHVVESPGHFRNVANLGIQAADALEHAHSVGVVHRDIKPGNLLIDTQGSLWVTDFGLARFQTDAALTLTGDLVGTLRYMSPEQALARRSMVDHRTDIYALGATLYELLTLEPVLAGRDRHELLQQIAFEEPVAPRQYNNDIPLDLQTIVLKAMAKAVEDRYATAQELADDLRRFLDDKPILAKPPSLLEKVGRWSRRHKTAVLSAVALLLLAVVGLATATALIARQERETQLAYQAEAQQRMRFEENFQQARGMLDFFTQVSAEELADKPGVQSVRKKLLEAALDYYQGFIEHSDDDPSLKAELARSRLHVANILNEIGSPSDALAALEQARDDQERLVQDHPTVAEYSQGLFSIDRQWALLHGHGRLSLLTQKSVQNDLKLSEDQIHETARVAAGQQAAMENLRSASREDRLRQFEKLVHASEKGIATILEPEQARRLDQISLQLRGTLALRDPEVAAALELTVNQKEQIQSIQDEAHRKWESFRHRRFSSRAKNDSTAPREFERGSDPKESAKVAREKALDVLTDEQKAKWNEMNGKPFKGKIWFGHAHWHGPERLSPDADRLRQKP